MNYYTHNIGDFAVATQYLTDEELGVYVRLREQYLSAEKPLQCEWIALAMRTHCKDAVQNVLSLLFVEKDGAWHSEYLDKIISEYREKSSKASESAKKRWGKAKENQGLVGIDANAMRMQCERNANHKPITNNQEINKKTKQKKVVDKPEDVTEQVWKDFLLTRKEKKAPLTQTALDLIKSEAEKAGIGLNDALSMACSRGWQSFKAEWVQGVRNGSFSAPSIEPRPKSFETDWDAVDYGVSRPLSEC